MQQAQPFSISYVAYESIRQVRTDSDSNSFSSELLSFFEPRLLKVFAQPCVDTAFTSTIIQLIAGVRGTDAGVLQDFGILAEMNGRWWAFLSGGRCGILSSLRLVWSVYEFSGTSAYVFIPDTSFVPDNLPAHFGVDAPGRLIVTAASDTGITTSILTPRSFADLLSTIARPTSGQEVVNVSILGTGIDSEAAPFPRSRSLLTANTRGVMRVKMNLTPTVPVISMNEAAFLTPLFIDEPNMLGRLKWYFSTLALEYRRARLSALYTTMVQSSCWGKSRLAEQLLHSFLGCYSCFRVPEERETAYPQSAIWASFFLEFFEAASMMSESQKEVFCLLYLSALVLTIDGYVNRSIDQLLDDLWPMRETGLGDLYSSLECRVEEIRDEDVEGELRLRCEMLVLGQISGSAFSFGVGFLATMKQLMEPLFPGVFDDILEALNVENGPSPQECRAAAEFCSSRGFTYSVLNGMRPALSAESLPIARVRVIEDFVGVLGSTVAGLFHSRNVVSSQRLLILVFDEATMLTAARTEDSHGIVPFRYLRRALIRTRRLPIVALFIGTNLSVTNFYSAEMLNSDRIVTDGKLLQPLVLLPGKDVWERSESCQLRAEDMHMFLEEMRTSSSAVCQDRFLQKFCCFGRPIWQVMGENALDFAFQKLGFEAQRPPAREDERDARWLAALGACCSLDPTPSSALAITLVRSFMATLANVDLVGVPVLICTYISEPVLAAAAASVLFSRTVAHQEMGLDRAVEELQRAFLLGTVDKGAAAELVARVLLMAARNRDLDLVFRPITLADFVAKMLMPIGGRGASRNLPILLRRVLAFDDAATSSINFVQFVPLSRRHKELESSRTERTKVITVEGISMGLRRACAFAMMVNFPGIDFIIPLSLSNFRFGYVGVQIKCRSGIGPMNPTDVFEGMLDAWKQHAEQNVVNTLNILIQLGGSSSPNRTTGGFKNLNGYETLTICPKPPVALYSTIRDRGTRHQQEVYFLHIHSVDAFAGAIPSVPTRKILDRITRWGPDLVELSKVTDMHPHLFNLLLLLYGDNPGGVAFQTRMQNFVNELFWPLGLKLPEIFPQE